MTLRVAAAARVTAGDLYDPQWDTDDHRLVLAHRDGIYAVYALVPWDSDEGWDIEGWTVLGEVPA